MGRKLPSGEGGRIGRGGKRFRSPEGDFIPIGMFGDDTPANDLRSMSSITPRYPLSSMDNLYSSDTTDQFPLSAIAFDFRSMPPRSLGARVPHRLRNSRNLNRSLSVRFSLRFSLFFVLFFPYPQLGTRRVRVRRDTPSPADVCHGGYYFITHFCRECCRGSLFPESRACRYRAATSVAAVYSSAAAKDDLTGKRKPAKFLSAQLYS